MRRICCTLLFNLLATLWITSGYGQSVDPLRGIWVNDAGTRRVEFYTAGDKWFGKVVSVSGGAKGKPGDVIFRDLIRNGNSWTGKLVAPRGTASCTIRWKDDNTLEVTGTKGGMSKSVYWRRVE